MRQSERPEQHNVYDYELVLYRIFVFVSSGMECGESDRIPAASHPSACVLCTQPPNQSTEQISLITEQILADPFQSGSLSGHPISNLAK